MWVICTIRLITSPQTSPQMTPGRRHPLHIYTSVFFFQSHICCDVSMTPCTNIKTLLHLVTIGVAGKHVGVIEDELYLMRARIFEMYFSTKRKLNMPDNLILWPDTRTRDPGEDTCGCRVPRFCLRLAAAARGAQPEQDPGLAQRFPPWPSLCRDEAWRQEKGQSLLSTEYALCFKKDEPLKNISNLYSKNETPNQ